MYDKECSLLSYRSKGSYNTQRGGDLQNKHSKFQGGQTELPGKTWHEWLLCVLHSLHTIAWWCKKLTCRDKHYVKGHLHYFKYILFSPFMYNLISIMKTLSVTVHNLLCS